jgi:hypothetical protein
VGDVDLFGLSLHLHFDPTVLEVTSIRQEAFLGAEGSETTMVSNVSEGDVLLGGTRNEPTLGDVAIVHAKELATLELVARSTGPSTLAIDSVVGRRSDGSYVAIDAEHGELTLSEVAP